MNFKDATDQLFNPVDHGELAARLNVSVATIRQARLRPDALAHRAPPKDWEKVVLEIAEQRADYYRGLANSLRSKVEGASPRRPLNGRPITD